MPGMNPEAKPSPRQKRQTAPKETAGRKNRSILPAKRPANLEEARREMLRLVCLNSAAITQAVIDDALEGKYSPAKFLFEAVGLCAVKGDEMEDFSKKESLVSLLLKRWQLAVQEDADVTEVAEVTPDMPAPTGAPVES